MGSGYSQLEYAKNEPKCGGFRVSDMYMDGTKKNMTYDAKNWYRKA